MLLVKKNCAQGAYNFAKVNCLDVRSAVRTSRSAARLNPHDLTRNASGLIGGTGRPANARVCSSAWADTGGSIRGLYSRRLGLRPTNGMWPQRHVRGVDVRLPADPLALNVAEGQALGARLASIPAMRRSDKQRGASREGIHEDRKPDARKAARIGIARQIFGQTEVRTDRRAYWTMRSRARR